MRRHSDQHLANRNAARRAGEKRFVGDPCPQGHTTHYTNGDECVTCLLSKMKVVRGIRAQGRPPPTPRTNTPMHRIETPMKQPHRPMGALPVAADGWIKAPTRQQLMAGK